MEAPELERRLAAILAADVEEYSRLMHSDEETTMFTLSARRAVVDALIAEHRGRIVNTAGDSVLAEFVSVLDAISCAVAIQHAMDQANAGEPGTVMRFRIGINVGDVMVKDGDIFGDGVNVAARLEGLAEPGGICVSRGVRDHIRHKVAVGFDDLGEQSVKNIARPVRAFSLQLNGSAVPEGEPDTRAPEPPQADEVEIEFWDTIKHSTIPLEYRVYLERYPDGAFAPLARARIDSLEHGHIAVAAAVPVAIIDPKAIELAFWETVKNSTNPDMYEAYLEKYPDGEFAILAKAKLTELSAEESSEEHHRG